MSTHVERTVTASLQARELAESVWQLSSGTAGGVEIILAGVDSEARNVLRDMRASRAVISWHRGGARVRLLAAVGPREVRVRTAILHEPRNGLYDGLPLVRLDAAARRFWRRVFLLVRIPGGRRLLGLVARRAGKTR